MKKTNQTAVKFSGMQALEDHGLTVVPEQLLLDLLKAAYPDHADTITLSAIRSGQLDPSNIKPPQDSAPQKQPEAASPERKKQKGKSLLEGIRNWVESSSQSSHLAVRSYLQLICDLQQDLQNERSRYNRLVSAQPSRSFSILHAGQSLPQEYSTQIPANTTVIAINGVDYEEYSCFVALPVTLKTLKRELQRGVSTNNIDSGGC